MTAVEITRLIAITGFGMCVLGLALGIREIMSRPFKPDRSRPRGNVRRGVMYAFTLGMAPWEKESSRRHWLAYFRGILYHAGILMSFVVLFASPWLDLIPAPVLRFAMSFTAAGMLFGFAGIVMRLAEQNTRVLSLPDDYFSVFLSSLFVALAFVSLLFSAVLPVFYIVAAIMLVYIPFSKIRHCVYFFYSKFFFGLSFGRRGVIGQPGDGYCD